MEILCISDTHRKHDEIYHVYPDHINNKINFYDMIIHAGDISSYGHKKEIIEFLEWYSNLPFKHKILISGNHDFFFDYDRRPHTEIGLQRHGLPKYSKKIVDDVLLNYPNVIYLNNSGVEIDGIKIWGSPITPWFHDWAFNRMDKEIKEEWDLIPLDTNILITHGPVRGILDLTVGGVYTGCPYLLEKIEELKVLKFHICGHIHEGYGKFVDSSGITFINASVLNHLYIMTNPPTHITY